MRNKLYPTLASYMLILAMLACTMPSAGPSPDDLVATITAQALALESVASETPDPLGTYFPTTTLGTAVNTPLVVSTAAPVNTQPPQPAGPSTPSKPKDFDAKGSGTTITFNWTDKSTDENGFRIYQEGVNAPVVSVDAHPSTGGMTYTWSNLSCAFSGKFYIRAYNDQGESEKSNTNESATIPCQPSNLIGTGQSNTISFNWGVSNGHNETGFRIYQQGVSQPVGTRDRNKGSGGTNFDLTGVLCNTVGTYTVVAFNGAGESTPSNAIQAESVPCGPSNFSVTGTTKEVVSYTWTDNATSETGYHVYVDDVLYATLPSSSPMELTGPMGNDAFQLCGQTHTYSVTAFNYAGESTVSNHVGATTLSC
ncbi:MAG: hypothetical protein JNM55_12325 [Anaerolineales bacterium]|nr:hypothetical protein [Anaerolineales bacterium]